MDFSLFPKISLSVILGEVSVDLNFPPSLEGHNTIFLPFFRARLFVYFVNLFLLHHADVERISASTASMFMICF
jgi:hypothetical protein